MRVAAISDIHGNDALLKSCWQYLCKAGLAPQQSGIPVLNAGDNVSYGPDDNACIDFLRNPANNIISVAGNYDRAVAKFREKEHAYVRKWAISRPAKLAAIRESSSRIKERNREWLADLPKTAEVELCGTTFIVTHYRPGGEKVGLFDTTPYAELSEIARSLEGRAQVVVTGHTHTPFVRSVDGVLFVNPGSLGHPLDRPTFAVLDISERGELEGRIVECPDWQQSISERTP